MKFDPRLWLVALAALVTVAMVVILFKDMNFVPAPSGAILVETRVEVE